MRELLVDARSETGEDGISRAFRYYILVDEMRLGGGMACESYGVKIVGADGETAQVRNLTVRVERIDALMEALVRNAVSPVTLADVVADWL